VLRVGGLVLAAGAGSRMGHRPKCLLQLDGVSLLERQLQALSLAGVTPLRVVLGHHVVRIQQDLAMTRWAAQGVVNPAPQDGHVGSLRTGLQALPADLDAVIVALADQPLIHAQSIQDLLQAFDQRPLGTQLLRPVVQGLPGNPVVLSATVVAQILAGDAGTGVQQWQQAHPKEVFRWETHHAPYRLDVDHEDDCHALAALTGHRLRWPTDLRQPTSVRKPHR
jgi:molybdenum cofactor cytidylyltransferase